jgi:Na+/melibiose symporter-like transporter
MWAASTMLGGTFGLVLTGALLQTSLWWGSFFVASALVVLGCLVATVLTVPETRDPHPVTIDVNGAVLSLLAIGGSVLAITELPVRGVTDPIVAAGFIVAAIAGPAFVRWELRAPSPMLDVRLFTNRMFSGGVAGVFLLFVGCYGWFFLSFQYFAYVLGYNSLQGGLGLLPACISTVPCAVIGARLADRHRWRPVVVFSLAVLAVGSGVMAAVGAERSFWWIALSFFIFGIGLGTGQAAPTQAIVDALPPSKQGVASAVNDAARELGAAVGIAILGSAFNYAYRAKIFANHAGVPQRLVPILESSPADGLHAAAVIHSHPAARHIADAVTSASVKGWTAACIVATGVFTISAIIIHFAARERNPVSHTIAATTPARGRSPRRLPAGRGEPGEPDGLRQPSTP